MDFLNQKLSIEDWQQYLKQKFGGSYKQMLQPDNLEVGQQHSSVKKALHFGSITSADNKNIALLTLEVKDNVQLRRNRVAIRESVFKMIDESITHGLLVWAWHPAQEQYRLSFIAKDSTYDEVADEFIDKETTNKRYTFTLGVGEATRTAQLQLGKLWGGSSYDDWFAAFAVEPVGKLFFQKYKELYTKFNDYLYKEQAMMANVFGEGAAEKTVRDFNKKMMGRITFLYFLQRKGWLGCPIASGSSEVIWDNGNPSFLKNLFETCDAKEEFYKDCLFPLFYHTLNRKDRKNYEFMDSGTAVPYLNGGLFEEDGFKEEQLQYPPQLYKELFENFEEYNFTIDENSPNDQEVGIDPEMLGRIFENLLEDNNDKGAFYTPKNIVEYMCQQSLLEYLKTKLPKVEVGDLEKLIRNHICTQSLLAQDSKIRTLLNDLKVCDPAIGSGAFPMGILHELVSIHRALDMAGGRRFDAARTKKHIIQNVVYGVDIEKGAVDIARLRFWLSLVVDEHMPEPLPNLDFKIMQGNSLLESFKGLDLSKLAIVENEIQNASEPARDLFGRLLSPQLDLGLGIEKPKEILSNLISSYFNVSEPIIKKEIKNQINDKIIEHIENNIEQHAKELEGRIEDTKRGDVKTLKPTNQKKLDEWQYLHSELMKARVELLGIQGDAEKPYFLWHLFFKDVFDEGGFDIVIGNPPYIQLQKSGGRLANAYQAVGYKTFERMGDIYSLFYEKGVDILKRQGILCYITSNKWMRTNYGGSTREFFAKDTNPLLIVDFGNIQVFETATVDTNILILQKPNNPPGLNPQALGARLDKDYKGATSLGDYITQKSYVLGKLNHQSWVIGEKDAFDIKGQVEAQGLPLGDRDFWNIEINYGVKTGFNEAFIITKEKRDELLAKDPKSAEIIFPLLRGKDLSAWYPDYQNLYLIGTFPSLKLDIDNYPAIKGHLLSYGKERLMQDGIGRKKGSNEWFETQDQISYAGNFMLPKIIYPNMTKYLPFAYDGKDNYFSNDKSFILTGHHIKYLTCFLNSKLFKYCFTDNFPELLGGTREIRKVFFDKIPVKTISEEHAQPFDRMVEYLVELKKHKLTDNHDKMMQIYFEQVANGLVYEYYFPELFAEYNKAIHKHLQHLPELREGDDKLIQLRQVYVSICQQEHPVNQAVFGMTVIPQINLIHNAVK